MNRTKLASHGSLLLLVLFSVAAVFAQTITTGDVSGVVKDTTDAVVAGATVTLRNVETNDTRTAATNESGAFRFTFLKPGNYVASAQSSGLKSDGSKIAVRVGQITEVDLIAKLQATQEVIEVNSQASALNTENANLSATFSSKQVADLPAAGGDITTVAFTVPGVVMTTGGGYGNFASNGLPATSNLFTINGTDYNDPYLNLNNSGASNNLLGQNEIQEAAVVQNAYSVQYGRQAGAQVNYTTRSGTNDLHGNLLWNWNGTALNANSFFNNRNGLARPAATSNQWGASIGGRAIKNKLFFFADSEGLYYTLAASGVVSYPSSQLQQYILSTITPAQQPLYQKALSIWSGAPGAAGAQPITTGNGGTQDASGSLGCGPSFAGTNTPAPGGGVFGTDVPCGVAFASNGSNQNREWLMTTRADWNISDKQKVNFRFKHDGGFQPTSTSLLNPVLNNQSIQPQYEGQVNHTYIVSPTIVNNFIGSGLYYSAIFGPASVAASQAEFPTYFQFGEGGTNSGAFTSMGVQWDAFPQGRNVGQLQLVDDLSISKGNHTIKAGVNFRKNRVSDHGLSQANIGSYLFSPLTDFVNGTIANGSIYFQSFPTIQVAHIRFYNLGLYAQDEWAAKPNLKVTVGVRMDRTANPTCVDTCFSNLTQPFLNSSFSGTADSPYNQIIKSGKQAYYETDRAVFDPRVGVVWSPRGNGKTVVRGGFGIFSDLAPGTLVSSIFSNAPSPFQTVLFSGEAVNTVGDSNSAAAGALSSYNAFHNGFANGATFAQLSNAVPNFSPPNFFSIPSHLSTPRYLEYSFEIQQPIGGKNVVVATYAGNRGYNLLAQTAFPNASNANGFGGLPTAAKDPAFGSVTSLTNNGVARYNGLSIAFRRSFAYGFQGQIGYTWSHGLDTISNGGAGEPFSFQPGAALTTISSPSFAGNYSNSDYDIRHNLVADFTWDAPWKFSHPVLQVVAGGWTVAGKVLFRTGLPFSITDSSLAPSIDPSLAAPLLATYSATGSVNHTCSAANVDTACFSTSSFVAAGAETTFGNVARNSFYGPHFFDMDTSLYKEFAVFERYKFRIGVTALNVFNHPSFGNPGQNVAGGGFGLIGGTQSQPTGPYGTFQGSSVAAGQRLLVANARFNF
jgi:Carboxypeptidase regulatory-like domain